MRSSTIRNPPGADQKSLVDLLNRVPEAPGTAQEAAKWFDKQLIEQTQTAAKRAADVVNAGVERLFWASANR